MRSARTVISIALLLGAAGAIVALEAWHGPVVLSLSEEHGVDTGDLLAGPLVVLALGVARVQAASRPARSWAAPSSATMTLSGWIRPTVTQSGWRTIVQRQTDAYILAAGSDRRHRSGAIDDLRAGLLVAAAAWFCVVIAAARGPWTAARRRSWWLPVVLFTVGSLADAALAPTAT